MSSNPAISDDHLSVPTALAGKLRSFRKTLLLRQTLGKGLWTLVIALMAGWMLFVLDRFGDTPAAIRVALLSIVSVFAIHSALMLLRTFVESQGYLRIAKLIRQEKPVLGDQLVGALELADSPAELSRSRALCQAALEQVTRLAEKHDLRSALPDNRNALAFGVACILSVPILFSVWLVPDSVTMTLGRLVNPAAALRPFTFVRIGSVPAERIVPHDETQSMTVALDTETLWSPAQASLAVAGTNQLSERQSQAYAFEIPGLIEESLAKIRVGDRTEQLKIIPKLRPEMVRLEAQINLPNYLDVSGKKEPLKIDLRSGALQIVEGSELAVSAQLSSPLAAVTVNGESVSVEHDRFECDVDGLPSELEIKWVDNDGLAPKHPFLVDVNVVPDRKPSLFIEAGQVPARILDDQQIAFQLSGEDDFAVRKVGMEWVLGDNRVIGQRVLGGSDEPTLQLNAVFQATAFDVPPGEVSLRFWVVDDFPGREKSYSEPMVVQVLSHDEHAIWFGDEVNKWRQAAMDIRDRELMLFQRNRELSQVRPQDRDRTWYEALEEQAVEEQLNGRLLAEHARRGESLLKQAARNTQVNTDTIHSLARAVSDLEQIAKDRMPRVAELLEQASVEASKFAEMSDHESSLAGKQGSDGEASKASGEQTDDATRERLGLAGTTVVDSSGRKVEASSEDDSSESLLGALDDQEELVAKFDEVADEMSELLGRMEGSTLVKRLKAMSRAQDRVASELGRRLDESFGQASESNRKKLAEIRQSVREVYEKATTAVEDLEAFYDRLKIDHFGSVLIQIKEAKLLDRLADMEEHVADRPGASIASAEYWADNLDRWADDLIDPGTEETQPGKQSQKSLDPAIILEVLRLLEAEVNLREQTRVAEQGRTAMAEDAYRGEAIRLSESQDLIRDRLDQIVAGLEKAPDAQLNFATEIEVLSAASGAMADATQILVSPETGAAATAAETEAIELLLRSKKANPDSGGGGGTQAGGGAGGDTDEAAIALLGRGLDELSDRGESETRFATGRGHSAEIPEHWQDGLQRYHQLLESRRSLAKPEGAN